MGGATHPQLVGDQTGDGLPDVGGDSLAAPGLLQGWDLPGADFQADGVFVEGSATSVLMRDAGQIYVVEIGP